MKKINFWDLILVLSVVIMFFFLVFVVEQNIKLGKERDELLEVVNELNREIGEYGMITDFWEDYIDLLDEIYQGKINEAVLEERLYWYEQYIEAIEEYETKIIETINEMVTDYGLGIYNLEDLVSLIDDLEDNIGATFDNLENRVYLLENIERQNNELRELYNQFEDDMGSLISIIIYYYENTDQSVDLDTWVETNYPEFYERIINYPNHI